MKSNILFAKLIFLLASCGWFVVALPLAGGNAGAAGGGNQSSA